MLSIIIPTRNRADLLACALGSLTNQTLSPGHFEILVIDNGSTDHTTTVVKDLTSTLDNLQYHHEPEPGLHAGRHRGMMAAKGEILVFADDDIEALPTWLVAIEEAFSDQDVTMAGGNNLPMFLETPPTWLTALWNRPTDLSGRALPALSMLELTGPPRNISPYYVWGCNFAIRKDVLIKAGGFHPDGMPKESIRFRGDGETHVSRFVAESGMKCLFHPGASVYHKVSPERMTIGYFRQRGFNQGISDSYTQLRGEVVASACKHSLSFRVVRWGWRNLRRLWSSQYFRRDKGEQRAISEFEAGHREGFAYHQSAYRDDPEVREWVHRKRYY